MNLFIRITTRCNMLCDHCLGSFTADGEDMTLSTFKKCLAYARRSRMFNGLLITGGEPTVHPRFRQIMALAIGAKLKKVPTIVTNGKLKKRALWLAKLGAAGKVNASVSSDKFHEPISPEVIAAFKALNPLDPTINHVYNALDIDEQGHRTIPAGKGRAVSVLGYEPDTSPTAEVILPDGSIVEGEYYGASVVGRVEDRLRNLCKYIVINHHVVNH